jgi:hypothetical protein
MDGFPVAEWLGKILQVEDVRFESHLENLERKESNTHTHGKWAGDLEIGAYAWIDF